MHKTYGKMVLRAIRGSLSRFLAIFTIVALGAGFLAGLLASPEDMRLSADSYYDGSDCYDAHIVSTLGLTKDDLAAVQAVDGVKSVLPVYDTDLLLRSQEGDSCTARLHSLPDDGSPAINRTVLQEGRLPERPGECTVVLTKHLAEEQEWIGQTLELDPEEEDLKDSVPQKLTVVGTVKSPIYLSMEQEHTAAGSGTLGLLLYTVPESFNLDYYTGFYLTVEGAKEQNAFSSDYDETVEAVIQALEPLGEDRVQIRYEEIVEEATGELNDAKKEYEDKKAETEEKLEDARRELDDAQKEIEENQKKLKDAKDEIELGRQELSDGRAALAGERASAWQQITDGRAKVDGYLAQLNPALKQLEEAQGQLDAGYEQLKAGDTALEQAKVQLDQLEQQIAALTAAGLDASELTAAFEAGQAEYEQNLAAAQAAKAELDGKQAELDQTADPLKEQQAQLLAQRAQLDASESALQQTVRDTEARLDAAQRELEDAQAQYEDGLSQLEDGRKELEKGRKEYEDSKREADEKLAEAEEKLKDAESRIREIETGEWYLFTRKDNAGFSSYASNADKIGAIATVFPAFFFLVAALVALTTMTRMVEEERQQIGTLKALGYSSGKIAAKYLFYAASASILGSVCGLAFGLRLFPAIIINAYNIMYDIPEALTPFNLPYSLFSSAAVTACTLIATFSACRSELRETPARLMLPKAPKAGKRVFLEYITPFWNRLKFTQKVTARNLIRYKKRFFMTVIGIAGCTALLVTGFGIRDSISDIVSLQYEQLNQYQLMVALKEESALEGRDLQKLLEDSGTVTGFLPVLQDSGEVEPEKGNPRDDVVLFVPSDVSALPDYFAFRHRATKEPVEFKEDSVIITEKLSERQNLKAGDFLTVRNQDGREASFQITDICENYVAHYLYLSPTAYEKAFGVSPEMNSILCKLPGNITLEEEAQLSTRFLSCRDVAATRFTTELSESFHNTVKSLNSIVLVLIISAAVLAFVVLYNLTNINISEREKELATIKVLGFYDVEVSAYIYRETAILTIFGAAVGLVLGAFLHQFVIRTAEIDIVMFSRSVYPLSYVWSALLTVAFSVLVNLAMHRKLKNISMVESMKAPE